MNEIRNFYFIEIQRSFLDIGTWYLLKTGTKAPNKRRKQKHFYGQHQQVLYDAFGQIIKIGAVSVQDGAP